VRVTNHDDYVAEFITGRMLPSRDMKHTRRMLLSESAVLEKHEVHVWEASLDVTASRLATLRNVLSADELSRSHTYRFQDDRRHFVVTRGLLRTILARYLHANPKQLCFAVSETGKPELHPDVHSGIRFSLSYCGDRAVFALTQHCEVGVDIEQVRADFPMDCVAELFFSDHEQARFTSLPDYLRRRAFFACWCRKEAVLKALGYGLALGLDRSDISIALREQVRLLSTLDQAVERQRWSLIDLAVADGYEGAVALEMPSPILRYWDASDI
jgi:4'-phosphopantetheinyl transferase